MNTNTVRVLVSSYSGAEIQDGSLKKVQVAVSGIEGFELVSGRQDIFLRVRCLNGKITLDLHNEISLDLLDSVARLFSGLADVLVEKPPAVPDNGNGQNFPVACAFLGVPPTDLGS